jgi:hypothetical protein
MRHMVCATLAMTAAVLLAGAAGAKSTPVLGHSWAPNQTGYGQAHPGTVFNGGDPTGLVRHIRWVGWGDRMAVGSGTSTYVWPGTVTATNHPTSGARIVAFNLGMCHGRLSYNAVAWYFPKYGEIFDAHRYINACTGRYIGFSPRTIHCPAVAMANGVGRVTNVEVIDMPCKAALGLIAVAPAARYARSGGRFMQSGFRCGSPGLLGSGSALFDCQLGQYEFLYDFSAT